MRFWPLKVVDVGVEDSFGKSLARAAQLFTVWQQIGNFWSQFILTWQFTASLNRFFWRMHSTLGSFVPLAMFEFSRQGTVLQQTSHLYDLIRTDIMMEPMYSMLCLK